MWCRRVARTAATRLSYYTRPAGPSTSHWAQTHAPAALLRHAHTHTAKATTAILGGSNSNSSSSAERPRRRASPSAAKSTRPAKRKAAAAAQAIITPTQSTRTDTTSCATDTKSASCRDGVKEDAVKERALAEGDVRLAMRCLMTRHFAFESSRDRPQKEKERAQRAQRLAQLRPSLQRAEQKRLNSLRLMSDDAVSLGDGIVPYFATGYDVPTVPTISEEAVDEYCSVDGGSAYGEDGNTLGSSEGTQASQIITNDGGSGSNGHHASGTQGKSAWNTLNPVGIAAMMKHQRRLQQRKKNSEAGAHEGGDEQGEDGALGTDSEGEMEAAYCQQLQQLSVKAWETVTLQSLCQPDLTMYDDAHDIRIDSATSLERSESQAELAGAALSRKGQANNGAARGQALHDAHTIISSKNDDEAALDIDLDELMLSDLQRRRPPSAQATTLPSLATNARQNTSTHLLGNTSTSGGSSSSRKSVRTSVDQLRRQLAEEDDEQDFSVLPYFDRDENEL